MGGLITNIWHNYYSFSLYGKGKYAAYFPGSSFSLYEIFAYFLGISHDKFLYLPTNYYPTGFT